MYGDGGTCRCADGAAEDGAIATTHLISDCSPSRTAETAANRGIQRRVRIRTGDRECNFEHKILSFQAKRTRRVAPKSSMPSLPEPLRARAQLGRSER
jgi:hypothetical protein